MFSPLTLNAISLNASTIIDVWLTTSNVCLITSNVSINASLIVLNANISLTISNATSYIKLCLG